MKNYFEKHHTHRITNFKNRSNSKTTTTNIINSQFQEAITQTHTVGSSIWVLFKSTTLPLLSSYWNCPKEQRKLKESSTLLTVHQIHIIFSSLVLLFFRPLITSVALPRISSSSSHLKQHIPSFESILLILKLRRETWPKPSSRIFISPLRNK